MPLTRGNTAITILRIDTPEKLNFSEEALASCAFPPFQAGDEKIEGLVPIDEPYDTAWRGHPAFGEYVAFALRIDKKTVPGAVLKKHFEAALADELAKIQAEGGGKIGKTRKKELKEQIKERLIGKAEAVPAFHEIAINTATGVVYVASTSSAVIDLAKDYLRRFGVEAMEFFDGEEGIEEAAMGFLREIVMKGIKGEEADIYSSGKITVTDGDAQLSGQSKSDAEIKEIREAIQSGKWVTQTGIRIDSRDAMECSCTIDASFRLSAVKLPKTEEDKQHFEASFLERMYLIEKYTGILQNTFEAGRRAK